MDKRIIIEIEKTLNYTFKNTKIIERAFTHASYANQNNLRSYDRLEFFGDSILGFIITEKICETFPNTAQGELTSLKKTLVSTKPLSLFMRRLKLDQFIIVSKATKITDKICEDVFEAIVAAIYLDSNSLELTKNFVLSQYTNEMFSLEKEIVDYKSKVLEKYGSSRIKFKTVKKDGKEHNPVFTMALILDGVEQVRVKAHKKLEGEQMCAKIFLEK